MGLLYMVEGEAPSECIGAIKWFDMSKGYGFITVNGGKDVFLHVKELRRSNIVGLNDGAVVKFLSNKGSKGLFATDIKVLPGNAATV